MNLKQFKVALTKYYLEKGWHGLDLDECTSEEWFALFQTYLKGKTFDQIIFKLEEQLAQMEAETFAEIELNSDEIFKTKGRK